LARAAALISAAAFASACASAPVEQAQSPLAMCQALTSGDQDLEDRLARSNASLEDFCTCFVAVEAGIDEDTRADMQALMATIMDMREGTGRSTEDVAELMEDDRDGSLYGFPEERLKRGAQPIEDALSRARRDPESCRAS